MELGEFQLESIKLKSECVREYTTGHFSCLEGEFLLTRALGYYILQNRVLQSVEQDYNALVFFLHVSCAPWVKLFFRQFS